MDANERDWLGLRDRVCVVTGAASGIGRETAIQLAAVGARVVAIDRNANGCARTAEEVRKSGIPALALECDVTQADSVSAAADRALAEFGRCDVLVNNAGILQPGRLEALSLSDWNGLLQVNLLVPDVPAGEQALAITVGGAAANPTTLWVAPNH